MGAFRYADQERRNIAISEERATQQAALSGSIARKKALAADAAITKTTLGLGNVDNTSDATKPISTAAQTALNGKMADWVAVPATAASVGTPGQLAYESGQLYVCIATDTWQRAALTTW